VQQRLDDRAKASIFSGRSTTSITIGRSLERRRIFAVWTRLLAPKPAMPLVTATPESPASRARSSNVLPERTVAGVVGLADEDAQQQPAGGLFVHGATIR